jgi:hypothetical protein
VPFRPLQMSHNRIESNRSIVSGKAEIWHTGTLLFIYRTGSQMHYAEAEVFTSPTATITVFRAAKPCSRKGTEVSRGT